MSVENAISLHFSVKSFNVRGLRNYRKRRKNFNWFVKHYGSRSINFIQESHCTENVDIFWKQQWRGESFFPNGTNMSAGVIILVGKDLDFKQHKVITDDNGRMVMLLL